MPRTTIDIDGTVLRELKRRGRREHKSLGRLASELLADALSRQAGGDEQTPFEWKSAAMNARIDLSDKDALYRALDQR